MEVYISSKWGLYRKWFFLFASVLAFIGSLYIIWLHFSEGAHHQKGDIFGAILWLFMSGFLYYGAVSQGLLLVDGDKIVLKGLFKKTIYHYSEFKEFRRMPRTLLQTKFEIAFKDGKTYWFECEANNSRSIDMFMNLDHVIPDLNKRLKAALDLNKRAR